MIEKKIVVLGGSGVGKTCVVNRFVRDQFSDTMQATIGAAFMKKKVQVNGEDVALQIWDTAGQERFRSMAPMYYRGANAGVLVFDITSVESLDTVASWVDELHSYAGNDIVIVLCANKSDLRSSVGADTGVTQQAMDAYARSIGAAVLSTSAKTGEGVQALFDHVATLLMQRDVARRRTEREARERRARGRRLSGADNDQKKTSGGCC
jgi:small GTP-binding protein